MVGLAPECKKAGLLAKSLIKWVLKGIWNIKSRKVQHVNKTLEEILLDFSLTSTREEGDTIQFSQKNRSKIGIQLGEK